MWISRRAAISNSDFYRCGLGERRAELLERRGLDLPGALGREPQAGADLAQRLWLPPKP